MQLSDWQVDKVEQLLREMGANGTLLNELTDHWSVQIQLEMHSGENFEHALQKVYQHQAIKAKELIYEMEALRFPYVVSQKTVTYTGILAVLLLLAGLLLRLLKLVPPVGVLLPGYILLVCVFLPLWFLRRLYTGSDKVLSTIIFMNLLSLVHLFILWANHARSRWVALLSWCIVAVYWCLHYYYFRRKNKV